MTAPPKKRRFKEEVVSERQLRKAVAAAQTGVSQSGEPMGRTMARLLVEMGLLRAMQTGTPAMVLSAAAKLTALYALAKEENRPKEDDPQEAGDGDERGRRSALELGIPVSD